MPVPDRTVALALGNLALFRRDPGPLVSRIAQPVLLLLLLQPLYGLAIDDPAAGAQQLVLGHLILFSLLGMSIVGTAILNERRWHTFDRLRATPAHALELLAGKAVPILLFILAQQAVVLGLGIVVLDLRVASYPLLVLADLVWALTVLCLGTAVAVLVRSFAQLSAVVDIGASVAVGLGGCLAPMTAMPQWAQAIAPVWPAYWAMESLRSAVTGDTTTALTNCAVLGGIATLAAAVAGIRFARGWGRETLL